MILCYFDDGEDDRVNMRLLISSLEENGFSGTFESVPLPVEVRFLISFYFGNAAGFECIKSPLHITLSIIS